MNIFIQKAEKNNKQFIDNGVVKEEKKILYSKEQLYLSKQSYRK